MLSCSWLLHLLLLTSWSELRSRCLLDGVLQWKHLLRTATSTTLSRSAVLLIGFPCLRPAFLALASSVALLLLLVSGLRIHRVAIALSSPILRLVIATSLEIVVLVGGVRALLGCSSCPADKVVVVARLLVRLDVVAIASIVALVIEATCTLLLLVDVVVPLGASSLSSSVVSVLVVALSLHGWLLLRALVLCLLLLFLQIGFLLYQKSLTEIPLKMRQFSLLIHNFT